MLIAQTRLSILKSGKSDTCRSPARRSKDGRRVWRDLRATEDRNLPSAQASRYRIQTARPTMVKPFPSKTHIGNHMLHPETLMLNYGYDPQLSEGAVKPPVFLTSTFVFRTAEDGAAAKSLKTKTD